MARELCFWSAYMRCPSTRRRPILTGTAVEKMFWRATERDGIPGAGNRTTGATGTASSPRRIDSWGSISLLEIWRKRFSDGHAAYVWAIDAGIPDGSTTPYTPKAVGLPACWYCAKPWECDLNADDSDWGTSRLPAPVARHLDRLFPRLDSIRYASDASVDADDESSSRGLRCGARFGAMFLISRIGDAGRGSSRDRNPLISEQPSPSPSVLNPVPPSERMLYSDLIAFKTIFNPKACERSTLKRLPALTRVTLW
ncbi:hypothetical protein FB45DRAFT_869467 [Roridomyces roridus]|uniref:Uncharacterized protein n=1 Tax=Roridomyces roridus TaxID=1738132 RepID=A0AAD7BL93_9AGAR|nr:hypothetical protein FB45DRAFT_869467 [Roridomyces roridus]